MLLRILSAAFGRSEERESGKPLVTSLAHHSQTEPTGKAVINKRGKKNMSGQSGLNELGLEPGLERFD